MSISNNMIFQDTNGDGLFQPTNMNNNFLKTEQNFHCNRNEQINPSKYMTNAGKRQNCNEEPFNAKITFGPNQFQPYEKSRSISQNSRKIIVEQKPNKPEQNGQSQNAMNKMNSLRQFTIAVKPNSYFLAQFTNRVGAHNSFANVVLHLLYKIKPIRHYILKEEDFDSKNYKALSAIKSIFIKYPEGKKIDIGKFRQYLSQTFKNSNKNRFEMDSPNDPCELFFCIMNLIHSYHNKTNPIEITKVENCSCIVHKYFYLNIYKYDECECNSSHKSKCSDHNLILDAPIDLLIKETIRNSDNLYCSKEKFIYYFRRIIHYKSNVQCPLNGKDCNYNRTKRMLILNPKVNSDGSISLPLILTFCLDYTKNLCFNSTITSNINSNRNAQNNPSNLYENSVYSILNLMILIPKNFDLESLFSIKNGSNIQSSQYEFDGIIFKKPSQSFSCCFKNKSESNILWFYCDDENILTFFSWVDLIYFCLKNSLFPYMLFYKIINEELENEESYNGRLHVSKEEFKSLEMFAKKSDEYKLGTLVKMRTNEYLIENEDTKNNNSNKFNYLNNNDFKNDGNIFHKNSSINNPYKRDKKRGQSQANENINDEDYNFPLQIKDIKSCAVNPIKKASISDQNNPSKSVNIQGISQKMTIQNNSTSKSANIQNIPKTEAPKQKNYAQIKTDIGQLKQDLRPKGEIYIENNNQPITQGINHINIAQSPKCNNYSPKKTESQTTHMIKNRKSPALFQSPNPNYRVEVKQQTLEETWICSNCSSINKNSTYKCAKCKLINQRCKEPLKKEINNVNVNNSNSKVMNNNYFSGQTNICKSSEYLISHNSNNSKKNINPSAKFNSPKPDKNFFCTQCANGKKSMNVNEICPACGRNAASFNNTNSNSNSGTITSNDSMASLSKQKNIFKETQIVFGKNNHLDHKSRSKDPSPEQKYIVKRSGSSSINKKDKNSKKPVNYYTNQRYDNPDSGKSGDTVNSNGIGIKNVKIGKGMKNSKENQNNKSVQYTAAAAMFTKKKK